MVKRRGRVLIHKENVMLVDSFDQLLKTPLDDFSFHEIAVPESVANSPAAEFFVATLLYWKANDPGYNEESFQWDTLACSYDGEASAESEHQVYCVHEGLTGGVEYVSMFPPQVFVFGDISCTEVMAQVVVEE